MKIFGLLLTFLAGIFFLIGGVISLKFKNKELFNRFSLALALIIMVALIISDLVPEALELLEDVSLLKKVVIIGLFVFLGFGVLAILDKFIPDHHHEHHDNEKNIEEHLSHNSHVGLLTIISLILHNMIEGLAIMGIASKNINVGIFLSLSVALHNIPLGAHIFSEVNYQKHKFLFLALVLSSLLGGLIFLIFGTLSEISLAIITLITLGMILYIALMELLPEVISNIRYNETIWGIMFGLVVLILLLFI